VLPIRFEPSIGYLIIAVARNWDDADLAVSRDSEPVAVDMRNASTAWVLFETGESGSDRALLNTPTTYPHSTIEVRVYRVRPYSELDPDN